MYSLAIEVKYTCRHNFADTVSGLFNAREMKITPNGAEFPWDAAAVTPSSPPPPLTAVSGIC